MKFVITDIEVSPNAFVCGYKEIGGPKQTFEISARKYDLPALVKYFVDKDKVIVGYNCIEYDTPILNMLIMEYLKGNFWEHNYLIVCDACKDLSNLIIDTDDKRAWSKYKYANYFNQIDLMTMMASKALRVGLKPLQVSMCYPNVEEMVIDWNSWVTPEILDNIITYNDNDIYSTEYLLKLLKGDLKFRKDIEKTYGIQCLSKDGVGIGVDIFTKYICEELGLINPKDLYSYRDNYSRIEVKDFILPEIKFKTNSFKQVLSDFNSMVLNEFGQIIELRGNSIEPSDKKDGAAVKIVGEMNGTSHSFGLGGIHAINKPARYTSVPGEWYIIDCDVGSMYPSMSDAWSFGPKGFLQAFVNVIRNLKTERMAAKGKEPVKDKTLKLALNSILGHLRNKYSPYFAPEANASICVNGQLFLTMLIEDLELAGIDVFSSNTDGLTSRVHKSQLDNYYRICKEWEKTSRLVLEYVEYEQVVMRGVNSYVAFKKATAEEKKWNPDAKSYSEVCHTYDHPTPEQALEFNYSMLKAEGDTKIMLEYEKQKGDFIVYPRVGKGLNSLIIPKAIINYYGKGIPIEDTIKNVRSIYDYIIYQKVGRQFGVVWANKVEDMDEQVQHISRFFVSKKGRTLLKIKSNGSTTNLLKGYKVQLANDLRNVTEFDIDFSYYIKEAQSIINLIDPPQLTLF